MGESGRHCCTRFESDWRIVGEQLLHYDVLSWRVLLCCMCACCKLARGEAGFEGVAGSLGMLPRAQNSML
jgi:hypothetical protein